MEDFTADLCHEDLGKFRHYSWIEYKNGKITFIGVDYWKEEDEDYCFGYFLDEDATKKLFNLIGEEGVSIIDSIRAYFGTSDGLTKLRLFCEKHKIEARRSLDKYELGC